MKGLKVKICGMREPGNIRVVSGLLPDYMGFIFYPRSGRFVGDLSPETLAGIPSSVEKVGVFVNEDPGRLVQTCSALGIGTVQLHGDESPDYCQELSEKGYRIIKVFRIGGSPAPADMRSFGAVCDFFLFDTQTEGFGGSGKKFSWEMLEKHALDLPFFLSGGIGPEDAGKILQLEHPMLYGVDINSRFENAPAEKDPEACRDFIRKIREK